MVKRVPLEKELKTPKKRTVTKSKKVKVRTSDTLYRVLDPTNIEISMQQFRDSFFPIEIDLCFQSLERWILGQQMAFLNSCIRNINLSKFVLVNVEMCLEFAKLRNDRDSITYFQGWSDKGIKYLNVDSNNRVTTIQQFISGKLTVPLGKYQITPGRKPVEINSSNNTYETLPAEAKTAFDNNSVSVCVITDASREQLSSVFERMNSGEPLNEHEKINCVYSDICSSIRNLATDFSKTFGCFFTKSDINRRKLDHWISILCYKFFNGTGDKFNKKRKQKMYAKGSTEDKALGSFISAFTKFTKEMGVLDRFIRAGFFFDLFILTQNEITLNKRIKSYEDLKNDFISMISILYNDKTPQYTYIESDVTVPFIDLNGYDPVNTAMRFKAYEDFGFSVSDYSLQLDPKRTGNRMDKLFVAERDNYKLNDGTKIDPDELFSGKYALGHKVAHFNGGTSDPSNLGLEDELLNKSHGTEETVVIETVAATARVTGG